ncbi:MAG: hypothetical protein J6A08_06520 [Lachnospiraceae bacterium]|nr:hypothetical protein [Lachnospiraceae bacterium]
MEDLLSKIYDKVAFYEEDSIKLGKEFDTLMTELLEPLRESRTEEEVEEIRELIYQAAYPAEKHGFYIGIRFFVEVLSEIMGGG